MGRDPVCVRALDPGSPVAPLLSAGPSSSLPSYCGNCPWPGPQGLSQGLDFGVEKVTPTNMFGLPVSFRGVSWSLRGLCRSQPLPAGSPAHPQQVHRPREGRGVGEHRGHGELPCCWESRPEGSSH